MQKFYVAASHNIIKIFDKAGIQFPISKKALLDKVGKTQVQIDFDKKITMEEYCKDIRISDFANKSQFYNALIGSITKL